MCIWKFLIYNIPWDDNTNEKEFLPYNVRGYVNGLLFYLYFAKFKKSKGNYIIKVVDR